MSEHRTGAGPALRPVRDRDAIVIPMVLAIIAVALAALHVAFDKLHNRRPDLVSAEMLRFVDLGQELNLPTWFSSVLWLAAALVAFSIWRVFQERGYGHQAYWAGMVALFTFLSLDEAGKVHEGIGGFVVSQGDFSGFFTYAWVIVGAAFTLVIGAIYVRLLLRLKPAVALTIIAAAVVFLSGAVGVEFDLRGGRQGPSGEHAVRPVPSSHDHLRGDPRDAGRRPAPARAPERSGRRWVSLQERGSRARSDRRRGIAFSRARSPHPRKKIRAVEAWIRFARAPRGPRGGGKVDQLALENSG